MLLGGLLRWSLATARANQCSKLNNLHEVPFPGMEVASSVEQRGWKGDLEKILFIFQVSKLSFPSFGEIQLLSFLMCLRMKFFVWRALHRWDAIVSILTSPPSSQYSQMHQLDGVISENFLTCRDATKAHRLPI